MTDEHQKPHGDDSGFHSQDAGSGSHGGGFSIRSYFNPGEFLIHIDHDGSLEVGTFLETLNGTAELGYPLTLSEGPSLTFGSGDVKRTLMKVFVPELLLGGADTDEQAMDKVRQSVAVMNKLNTYIACSASDRAIQMRGASPNWLMGGVGHVFYHPSPGGRPSVPNTQYYRGRNEFELNRIDTVISRSPKPNAGQTVNVVIFDTVPAAQTVTIAADAISAQAIMADRVQAGLNVYENMRQVSTRLEDKLEVVRAGTLGIQLLPPPPPDPADHDTTLHFTHGEGYEMSDHGLFIAGIIHSIAPQVDKIYLVETMNTYGVGTVDALAVAIHELLYGKGTKIPLARTTNQTLIVNCSLTVDCPQPDNLGQIVLPFSADGSDALVLQHADRILAAIDVTFEDFEASIGLLSKDALVIAAAGNDGPDANGDPHPASYPAAFERILGVGAMENPTTRAAYSNLADNPTYHGIMAFGGMGNFNTATQASSVGQFRRWYMTNNQEGILGLYTGEFPITDPATGAVSARGTGTSSPNGWGMWAGTSFATGVVTGIFARAAQAGCVVSLKQPNNFYRGLESEGFPVTRYGELIVFTPQGQSAVLPGLFQWVVVIWNWLQTLVRPRSTKPTP